MTAEMKANTIRVLIGPTFWAAMSGRIRPMMEQPLQMANLDVSAGLEAHQRNGRAYA
jgi:hypothetical protein